MISAATRHSLAIAVFAVHGSSYDVWLDAWADVGDAIVKRAYHMGWRPMDPTDREAIVGMMASGNLGSDAPLVEHIGSIE